MSFDAWITFVVIWILASIPLGPNAFNCISTAVADGFKKSLLCILGILLAASVYIVVVSSGLSAILIANEQAFIIVKVIGAAYLICLGIKLYSKRSESLAIKLYGTNSRWRIVRNSFLISMSNPKAVLSYVAVFSQFIDQNSPLQAQLLILVPSALVIVAMVYSGYCWIGLGVEKILDNKRKLTIFNRSIGTAYIAAGAAIIGYESVTRSH